VKTPWEKRLIFNILKKYTKREAVIKLRIFMSLCVMRTNPVSVKEMAQATMLTQGVLINFFIILQNEKLRPHHFFGV
jgi:hypothetical protein